MQQIYKRTPMPKCDFNKVALQLDWSYTSALVFPCKFAAYFQNTFFLKTPKDGCFCILVEALNSRALMQELQKWLVSVITV